MSEIDKSIGDEKTMLSGSEKAPDLSSGQVLGQYKIIKLLGRGGMGQVYLVQHEILQTRHALKLLPESVAKSSGFVERFRNEARVMAQLQHPGIVHVTHADESNGRHYLIMDFVGADGTEFPFDLEDALAEAPEGRLVPAVVSVLAEQIADAVAYAHSKGVVHRDLKPANVLLITKKTNLHKKGFSETSVPSVVKITDFGLARMAGEDWVNSVIQASLVQQSLGDERSVAAGGDSGSSTNSILGTYEYMSPEQREGREADERSDIYSFGVMLYRMLTGKRIMGFPKPPSRVVEGLDPKWDDLIIRCLDDNPSERFQTLENLKAEIPSFGNMGLTTEGTENPEEHLPRKGAESAKGKRPVDPVVSSKKETAGGGVVPKESRNQYAENGGNCGDGLAWALERYLQEKETVSALENLGRVNGVDVHERWGDQNPGMQRMNLGNVLRGMIRRGEKVEVPDVCEWNPEPGIRLSYSKKQLHFVRQLLEDLLPDDVFEVATHRGTIKMSRAQFETVFCDELKSFMWKQQKHFHCQEIPEKVLEFFIFNSEPDEVAAAEVPAAEEKKDDGKINWDTLLFLTFLAVVGFVLSGFINQKLLYACISRRGWNIPASIYVSWLLSGGVIGMFLEFHLKHFAGELYRKSWCAVGWTLGMLLAAGLYCIPFAHEFFLVTGMFLAGFVGGSVGGIALSGNESSFGTADILQLGAIWGGSLALVQMIHLLIPVYSTPVTLFFWGLAGLLGGTLSNLKLMSAARLFEK